MKRFFLLAAVCISFVSVFGQQVTGAIIGEEITVKKGDVGYVVLKISPAKAVVYINDIKLNGIPQTVKLNVGEYTLYVEADGYPSQSKNFVIEKDKTCTVEVTLTNTEIVSIETNVPSSRKIDGVDYQEEKLATYELTYGRHTVEFTANGYRPLKKTIEVKAGKSSAYSFTLQELPPTPESDHTLVTIETNVPCRRMIDGVEYATSQSQAYEMKWGEHSLNLTAEGYYPVDTKVNVVFQGRDKFRYTLSPEIEEGLAGVHEIGAIVGGLNGLSYKHWFTERLALQMDFALGVTQVYCSHYRYGRSWYYYNGHYYDYYSGSCFVLDLTANPNVLYHFDMNKNFKFYTGGGLSFGYLYENHYSNNMGKFGLNAMLGFAIKISKAPVMLAFDFRPGYGLGFNGNDYTMHFFDWKLGFAVRYCFKK